MNKHLKKISVTIGITGIGFIINYMITLFLTPYITDTVGTEAYGFVSLAKNIAQYATYVTLALNSFATRFISVAYHNKNYDEANTYFSSTYYGDLGLGSIILAAAAVMILNISRVFQIPAELVTDIQLLFLFVFIKFWVTTVLSVNEASAMIANELYVTSATKLAGYGVEAALLIALYHLFKPNVFYVGIAIMAASIVECAANVAIRKRYTPELSISRSHFSWKAVKTLVVNGIWTSITSVGNFLHSGLDLMVCNLMLSPLAMGQLAISENVVLIFKSLLTMASRPFQPYYLKDYADGDIRKLLKHMTLAMKTSSMFTNACFAGFMSLGMVYYRLWIPNQNVPLIWKLSMISIATCVCSGIVTPVYYVYTLAVRKKIPCLMTIGSGALNVISMYFLIKYTSLGVYAVVWTTAVIVSVLELVGHPLYAAHVLRVSYKTFYPCILRCLASCMAVTAVMMVMRCIYMPHSWLTFALCVLIYGIIGALVHILVALTKEEKAMLVKALNLRFTKA